MPYIQYAINRDNIDIVVSRCGNHTAWPIKQHLNISDLAGKTITSFEYQLTKRDVCSIGKEWDSLVWTRYVPITIKNFHRKFWGLPQLIVKLDPKDIPSLLKQHKTRFYYKRVYAIGDRAAGSDLVGIYHSQWGEKTRTGLFHWFRLQSCHFRLVEITTIEDHESFKVVKNQIRSRPVQRL